MEDRPTSNAACDRLTHSKSFPSRRFTSVKSSNGASSSSYSIRRPVEHDLTIITSDSAEIQVASAALCDQSEYFVGLLSSGMVEERSRTVTFVDLDSTCIEPFVRFCCTGDLFVCGDNFLPLLKLASRFICSPMLAILKDYIRTDFISVPQNDLSTVMTEPIDSGTAALTRQVLLEMMIPGRMLDLKVEVIHDLLKDDNLVSAKEDDVLQFVCDYARLWKLDSAGQLALLNHVRLPRLTMTAFERAAISLPGFKDSPAFEAIVNGMEFLDLIGENQLKPRRGSNVHVTMLWIGDHHEEGQSSYLIVYPLVIPYKGTAVTPQPKRRIEIDRSYLTGVTFFSLTPYFSAANHLFSISVLGQIEKLTFKKRKCWRSDNCSLQDNLMEIEQVIGVDTEEDCFYLSCVRKDVRMERVFVLKCHLVQKDNLRTEKVAIPLDVASIRARRMVYRRTCIVVLDEKSNLLVYAADKDSLYQPLPPDASTSKYIQIAVQGERLYVFDYSECPVHLHDFSQPFSRFDKLRVFNLATRSWIAEYPLQLNELRQSGYNELIDFNVDMYFIRGQLHFAWSHQGRMYLFRVDEVTRVVDRVFDCKLPRDASAMVLLPGFYAGHDETTVLEKYVHGFCQKHLQVVGENRLAARKVARWRARFLDEVHGSGLLQQNVTETLCVPRI